MKFIHSYIPNDFNVNKKYTHIIWKEVLYGQLLSALMIKRNQGNIKLYTNEFVMEQIVKIGIPYDEIHFGKPYANFYIDDLAVNANSSLDKAVGIYNTNTPPRSFNKVEYTNDTVTKTTSNDGEIYWYNNIPGPAKKYFPKVLGIVDNKITLENINGVSYSYLYTNKSLTENDITELISALQKKQ